jgi:hypothetical protein
MSEDSSSPTLLLDEWRPEGARRRWMPAPRMRVKSTKLGPFLMP